MTSKHPMQLLKFPSRLGNGSIGLFSNVNVTKIIDNVGTPANSAAMRPFIVRIQTGAKSEELNVLAESSCDAITRAMDILFEDDAVMPPTGLFISAHPIATLPMVA